MGPPGQKGELLARTDGVEGTPWPVAIPAWKY